MDILTAVEFRARFPEFSAADYPDAQVEAIIADTDCNFDYSRWGSHYKRGHSLMTAHILSLRSSQSAGDAGAGALDRAQSESADGVSVSYATMTPSDYNEAFWTGTSYGAEYLMLLRAIGIGAVCCGQ